LHMRLGITSCSDNKLFDLRLNHSFLQCTRDCLKTWIPKHSILPRTISWCLFSCMEQ